MVNKQLLIFGFLFLVFVPFCFAAENDSIIKDKSLGTFYLFGQGEPIAIEDALVFVCIFIIFLAIVYEMVNLLGFIEKFWMKAVISFIVVLLINIHGFIYNSVFFLKDIQNFVNLIASLTLSKVIFILIILVLVAFMIIMLRSLVGQWKKDAKKEEEEREEIREEQRKKVRKLRDGF